MQVLHFGRRRFSICQTDPLSRLFESAELHNVEVHSLRFPLFSAISTIIGSRSSGVRGRLQAI